jgi:hypothetical protein
MERCPFEQLPIQPVQPDMKLQKVAWPIVFLVTGLVCWLAVPSVPKAPIATKASPAPQRRISFALNDVWAKRYKNVSNFASTIRVENDATAAPGLDDSHLAASQNDSYHPYFMQVNDTPQISIWIGVSE